MLGLCAGCSEGGLQYSQRPQGAASLLGFFRGGLARRRNCARNSAAVRCAEPPHNQPAGERLRWRARRVRAGGSNVGGDRRARIRRGARIGNAAAFKCVLIQ